MDLFVYGTLRCAALRCAVAGGTDLKTISAQLDGYSVRPVADNVVPLIREHGQGQAIGLVLRDVDPAQHERLDLFEGAFGFTLTEVTVQTEQGPHVASMYVPPAGLACEDAEWSLENWEMGHLEPTLYAVREIFAHSPMLDHASLRRLWPMMEKRAWAKFRAANSKPVASIRYQPSAGDVEMFNFEPPTGAFFKFDAFAVNHRRFDGSRSDDLPREIFVGTDAALILPYDVQRDRVLLVEQLRLGPALRGDPVPWSLEPIAGMVDARETPLEAALREAEEEAALTIEKHELMLQCYPSPGGSTDHFYCYLGLCALPETDSYTGGLATENEDLRLHVLDFESAMALIGTGEINIGPLITMLYWLDRERDRLRTTA